MTPSKSDQSSAVCEIPSPSGSAQRDEYVCPECLGKLAGSAEAFECVACGHVFPIVDTLPIFAEHPSSGYGTMADSELNELLRACKQHGWEQGVRCFLEAMPSNEGDFWARYLIPETRAAGRILLPPNADAKVLDLGCGVGTLSLNFARHVRDVVAVDCGEAQLRVLGFRAKESGLRNIRLACGGDRRHLPFPSGTFDVVLLNGVLEWVGTHHTGDPRTHQQRFLAEVSRILKPTGSVYIGIENRFSYAYLRGMPDDHTQLRFVPLLPRKIADLLSRFKTGRPYRVYTYSRWGYANMLDEAGLAAAKFYVPRPNYRNIRDIVITRDHAQTGGTLPFKKRLHGVKRQRLKALAYPYLGHSYSIVARRDNFNHSLIEEAAAKLADHLAEDDSKRAHFRPDFIRIGDSSVATVCVAEEDGPRTFALKIPLTPEALIRLRQSFQVLDKIRSRIEPDRSLVDLLPAPITTLECAGQVIFVQRYCPGFDLGHCYDERTDRLGVFRLGLDALLQMHRELDGQWTHSIASLQTWICKREQHISESIPTLRNGSLKQVTDYAMNYFRQHLPLSVWTHGDFCPANLLSNATGDRLTGIVDWEFADPEGVPLLDLLQLLFFTKSFIRGQSFSQCLAKSISASHLNEDEAPFVEEYCRELRIPDTAIRPLALMAWLDWVYRRATSHAYVAAWRHSEIESFIEFWADRPTTASACLAGKP